MKSGFKQMGGKKAIYVGKCPIFFSCIYSAVINAAFLSFKYANKERNNQI